MIVQNRKVYADAYDLSGYLSAVEFEAGLESQDDTVFGDGARSSVAGLDTATLVEEGIWDAGAGLPDTVLWSQRGLAGVLATFAPVNGNEGSLAYFMRTTQGLYAPGAQVGEILRFSVELSASGDYGAIRGTVMSTGAKTATGNSTKRQLGAVSATQKLYAGLHVLSVSGSSPTIDVTVRSDADSSSGSETTRITFAQQTAVGSVWATPVAGAITDEWWDVRVVIGGSSTPTFGIVVVVGIQ
ncbi:MAG: hypothetical protein ABL993_05250 [Vicinamibacterales bacterium]